MRKSLLAAGLFVLASFCNPALAQPFCPGVSPWVFDDVALSDPFCSNITWMAQKNITLGCSLIDVDHRLYCPDTFVNRKAMAAFMNRLGDALFPSTCAAGQVMKWDGAIWACANDNTGTATGTVTSVLAGTGLQGSPNPITGAGSINLAPSYQLPQACTSGQVASWNGSAWTCASAGGVGTVTSVGTGAGLTGGPITATGTINLLSTQLLPTVACAANQIPKWSGTAWQCQADLDTNSGGTVTSVGTGAGLSGGPITATGTINLASTQLLPTVACAANQIPKWSGTAWQCQADLDTNSGGTVTSVATGTGLTGGPITATGTIAVDTAQIQARVSGTCAVGSSIRTIAANGAVTCEAAGSGTVTSVGTGTGLTGGPITGAGTIAVDTTQIQARVSGTCAAGSSIRSIAANGTVTCETDDAGTGTVTSLSQGTGITLSADPITTTGSISADTNYLQRRVSATCAVGSSIRVIAADGTVTCQTDNTGAANAFAQGGNAFAATAVLGTTDDNALDLRVNGSRVMRYEPNAISPNVIGGHPLNNVSAGVRGATIAGGGVTPGGDPDYNFEGPNVVTDIYGTVGGGYGNRAGDTGDVISAAFATIAGGLSNTASGFASSIGGGDISVASGSWSTVGGGINQLAGGQGSTVSGGGAGQATGNWATVPGGNNNVASGFYSFAAGNRAKTQSADPTPVVHDGAFVWADSSAFDFNSTAANQFAVRATGGARIVLGIDGGGAPTWTCAVASGGSWACSSDRNLKQNLRQLDGQTVLAQLAAMPIYSWNPKGENAHTRHFGPTAQDFHAAFGLGDSELRIGQQDADGVALAAIQGLNMKLDAAIAERDARIAAQDREITELRRAVEVLMARTSPEGKLAQSR